MKKGLLIAGGLIVAGTIGYLLYRKFGKSSSSSSFDANAVIKAMKDLNNDDVDAEITAKVLSDAVNDKAITNNEVNKYITIVKRIAKEKSEKSLTKEEKDFLNDFMKKTNKYKIQKISLVSTDGKTANFDVYANDKKVVFDLTKKGNKQQLDNKFKDFYLQLDETNNDFTISFKKGNVTYNSWMINKKTNEIKKQ
jgi:hypothetical protein